MAQSLSFEISVFHCCWGGEGGRGTALGSGYLGSFHQMASFQESLSGRTDWPQEPEIRKRKEQNSNPNCCVCEWHLQRPGLPHQAVDDVLWLHLITDALEGRSMSATKNLHSWPGPWGFAPRSSSPAHMGVMAQKLSNWNQWKGKAWNLGKAEHSCSELQSRLSTFADEGPCHIGQAFTQEAKNRRPNRGVWPGRTFLRGKIHIWSLKVLWHFSQATCAMLIWGETFIFLRWSDCSFI